VGYVAVLLGRALGTAEKDLPHRPCCPRQTKTQRSSSSGIAGSGASPYNGSKSRGGRLLGLGFGVGFCSDCAGGNVDADARGGASGSTDADADGNADGDASGFADTLGSASVFADALAVPLGLGGGGSPYSGFTSVSRLHPTVDAMEAEASAAASARRVSAGRPQNGQFLSVAST
jgi:hypothetical protein